MLTPKRVKHRKWHKGSNRGIASSGTEVAFGSCGLKAMGRGRITARQIEASRRAMTRYIKKEGKIWIRIFPDKPITFKGVEIGMGGGKGAVDHYVVEIKPGRVLFEMDGLSVDVAKEALHRASAKLPMATKFVLR